MCLSHVVLLYTISKDANVVDSYDVMLCSSSLSLMSGVMVLLNGKFLGTKRIVTNDVYSSELQCWLNENYKVTYALNPLRPGGDC